MAGPVRELEFINMTNQSEEEKRERISKTRAVMMKDSHRERRLKRETDLKLSKGKASKRSSQAPASSSGMPEETTLITTDPLIYSEARDALSGTADVAGGIGATTSFLHTFAPGFEPSTIERLPFRALPQLPKGVRETLKTANEPNIIDTALVPLLHEQDPSLVISTLASSAVLKMLVFNDLQHRRPFIRQVHQQYGVTIKLLNEALATPSLATELPVIAAVASIMGSHFVIGCEMHEFDVHEAGAQKIIELRGGLGTSLMGNIVRLALDLLRILRRLAATMQLDGVQVHHYQPSTRRPLSWQHYPSSYRFFTLRSFPRADSALRSNAPLLDVLSDLQDAVHTISILASRSDVDATTQAVKIVPALRRWERLKARTVDEHWNDLTSLQSSTGLSRDRHILDACRIALISFVVLVDLNTLESPISPTASTSYERSQYDLVSRLHYHISEADIEDFWLPTPGALLWCAAIGSMAAMKTRNIDDIIRSWFRMQLFKTCVAYWFATGEPGGEVVESFEAIEQGLRAAVTLTEIPRAAFGGDYTASGSQQRSLHYPLG